MNKNITLVIVFLLLLAIITGIFVVFSLLSPSDIGLENIGLENIFGTPSADVAPPALPE